MSMIRLISDVEKFTSFKIFFTLGSFLLFLDIFSSKLVKKSLLDFNTQLISDNFISLIMLLPLFSLYVATIPPVIIFIIKSFKIYFSKAKKENTFEKENYITESQLLKKALSEQNKIDFDYLISQKNERERIDNMLKISIVFLTTVLLNYYYGGTIIEELIKLMDDFLIIKIIVWMLFPALILFIYAFSVTITDKIYYPRIDNKE